MEDVYLSLETKDFDDFKQKGISEAQANGDEESICFPNLRWRVLDKPSFENGRLYMSGDMLDPDLVNRGYLSTTVALDLDTVVTIIEFYMKKLGKLKTVLEATK